MKLIYLSEMRLPTRNAHGFQIMRMCSAFARHVKVELLVPSRETPIKEDPFEFYNIEKNFTITKLPSVDLYPFSFIPERVSYFAHLFSFLISARVYLWRHGYDCLYSRERFVNWFFKKFVAEVHTLPSPRGAEKYVTITHALAQELEKSGIKKEKILVVPDAVDLTHFRGVITKHDARAQLGLSQDQQIVLYLGNFRMWKGVDTLAYAIPLLPDAHVMLVGGTKDSDLDRIRGIAGMHQNATVLGFREPAKVPIFLAAADVLVLPNTAKAEISARWTSPMKLFEYMSAERPIVASDLPSLREVADDTLALFVPPDDPEALARGVLQVLNNSRLADTLATHARKEVEKHTWNKRAEKILEFSRSCYNAKVV